MSRYGLFTNNRCSIDLYSCIAFMPAGFPRSETNKADTRCVPLRILLLSIRFFLYDCNIWIAKQLESFIMRKKWVFSFKNKDVEFHHSFKKNECKSWVEQRHLSKKSRNCSSTRCALSKYLSVFWIHCESSIHSRWLESSQYAKQIEDFTKQMHFVFFPFIYLYT